MCGAAGLFSVHFKIQQAERRKMADIKYEITQKLGVLSVSRTGWSKEVNMVAWNGRNARLDLREWSQQHDKMSKGVTLSKEEAMELFRILKEVLEI